MCGELPLVVPGRDDDALAGVRGEAGEDNTASLATTVAHLHTNNKGEIPFPAI